VTPDVVEALLTGRRDQLITKNAELSTKTILDKMVAALAPGERMPVRVAARGR